MTNASISDESAKRADARKPINGLFSRLQTLGQIRDGILVSGAVFYGIGYLIWSFHAWNNNLGFLPALDLQYFVAGIVPTLILLSSLVFGKWLYTFVMHKWPKIIGSDASGFFKWVRYFMIGLLAIAFFLFILTSNPTLTLVVLALILLGGLNRVIKTRDKHFAIPTRWRRILVVVILLVLLAAIFFADYLNEHLFSFVEILNEQKWLIFLLYFAALLAPKFKGGAIFEGLKIVYFALTILLVPILGLLIYMEEIYPNLPQEFGGVSPRCAAIDFRIDKLSPEIQLILTHDSNDGDSTIAVIHSKPLQVYYSNEKILIVKLFDQEAATDQLEVYEIKKADVHTITWCDLE